MRTLRTGTEAPVEFAHSLWVGSVQAGVEGSLQQKEATGSGLPLRRSSLLLARSVWMKSDGADRRKFYPDTCQANTQTLTAADISYSTRQRGQHTYVP